MEISEIDDPESTSSSIAEEIETLSQALLDSKTQTKMDLNLEDTTTTTEESVGRHASSLDTDDSPANEKASEGQGEMRGLFYREGSCKLGEDRPNVDPTDMTVPDNNENQVEDLESAEDSQDAVEDFFARTPPLMSLESNNGHRMENLSTLGISSRNDYKSETDMDMESVKSLRQEEAVVFPRTPSAVSINRDITPLNMENSTPGEFETLEKTDDGDDEANEGNKENSDSVVRTLSSLSILPMNERTDEITPMDLQNSSITMTDDQNELQTIPPFYLDGKRKSGYGYLDMQLLSESASVSEQTIERSNENQEDPSQEKDEEEVKSAEAQEEEEDKLVEIQEEAEAESAEAHDEAEEFKSAEVSSMTTAGDVSKKIQSNANHQLYFTVGYKNQFGEDVEKPFTSFYRDQLPYVGENTVQYFKYKGIKVWDKVEGFDHVFGSAGRYIELEEKVNEIEDGLLKRALAFIPDDEESDEDNFVILGGGGYGQGLADSFSASSKPKATHFLCIKVKNDQVKSVAAKVKERIIQEEPDLLNCAMPNERLHVTLVRVHCNAQDAIIEVNNMLRGLRPRIQDLVGSSEDENPQRIIRARQLSSFGDRELYVKLDVPAAFISVIESLQESLSRIKNVVVTNHFESIPHMTLLKVNRATARKRGSKTLDSSLYSNYVNQDFGSITFDNIHFCLIDDIRAQDGFYITSKKIEF